MQITAQNVKNLTLAWAFQTEQSAAIKATPILVDGILYFTIPDNIWAIDARSARQLWRYTYPTNQGFHIGHRGAAVYKDSVYLTTPDYISTLWTHPTGQMMLVGCVMWMSMGIMVMKKMINFDF